MTENTGRSDQTRDRLLAIIAVILLIAALKVGYPVLMPVVVSFCIIASAWPIKRWADGLGSPTMSYVVTIVVLALGLAAFFGVVSYALAEVVNNFANQRDKFRELFERMTQLFDQNGLTLPSEGSFYQRIVSMGRMVLTDLYTVLSYMGAVAVIVILGFPEVPKLANKFRQEFESDENQTISTTVQEIAHSLRSYLAVTTMTSLITGVASGLLALSLGLDLALIWGILNFLLNFIPVVGNIIGILPPTLYAFIQFGGWVMPLIVFAGFVVLQLVISNFIYPMMQSRGVSLPPITIIVSLLFWGWLWGVAGGLLAIPLTAMLVIVCRKFEATHKFAVFIGGRDDSSDGDD